MSRQWIFMQIRMFIRTIEETESKWKLVAPSKYYDLLFCTLYFSKNTEK